MSDGIAVVMWDAQWEMKPAPAPVLLQHPGAFTWLLVQVEASGEVWVALAMEMCQMDLCDEGRKEKLSHPSRPELAEQGSPRDVLNSSH